MTIPEPARPAPHARRAEGKTPAAKTKKPKKVESPAAASAHGGKGKDVHRTLLTVPTALQGRMIAVLAHTRPSTGITSQQQFIRLAIERLCERLEAEHNGGQQFPPPAQNVTL